LETVHQNYTISQHMVAIFDAIQAQIHYEFSHKFCVCNFVVISIQPSICIARFRNILLAWCTCAASL